MGEKGVNSFSNKQIIFKDYINGFPKESNMILRDSVIELRVPEGCNDAVLVKNLYLSCDPYMRSRMSKLDYHYIPPFTPAEPLVGMGVSRVMDSSHPNFKKGEFVWGMVGWEEYTLNKSADGLFKIQDTDVPLSYYTGILGFKSFREIKSINQLVKHDGAATPWIVFSSSNHPRRHRRESCYVPWRR